MNSIFENIQIVKFCTFQNVGSYLWPIMVWGPGGPGVFSVGTGSVREPGAGAGNRRRAITRNALEARASPQGVQGSSMNNIFENEKIYFSLFKISELGFLADLGTPGPIWSSLGPPLGPPPRSLASFEVSPFAILRKTFFSPRFLF